MSGRRPAAVPRAGRRGAVRRGAADMRPPAPAGAAERRRELDRLARLAHLLDARFRLPGTPIRFGLDGLLGLLPGIGDALATLPSAYLLLRGWQLGARRRVLARMALTLAVDLALGAVPLAGDVFDIAFKGNLRNVRRLEAELGGEAGPG